MNQGKTMNIIKYVLGSKRPRPFDEVMWQLLQHELARLIEAEAELLSREDDNER